MGSSQSTISFLDEVLTNFDHHTLELDSKFLPLAANAKISLGTLKRAIIRDQIEAVAAKIQNGELEAAKETLGGQKIFKIDVGTIEEIVRLAYAGDGANLLNSIKFAASYVSTSDLKFPALKAIHEEMMHLGHTHHTEILLLHDCLKDKGSEAALVKHIVETFKKVLVKQIIVEFSAKDYAKCVEISNKLEPRFLGEVIAAIVAIKFTGSIQNMCHFIHFVGVLEKPEFVGTAVYELFRKFQAEKILATFAACNLWAMAKYLAESSVKAEISTDTNKLLKTALNEMNKFKNQYLLQYSQLISDDYADPEDIEEKISWREMHVKNPYLGSILTDFVEYFFQGEMSQVPLLLNAANNLPLQIEVTVALEAIYEELVKHKKLESFECYLLFKSLRRLTNLANYEPSSACDILTRKTPKSISTLFSLDSSKKECRIVNSFYNEKLIFKAPNSLYTVPCEMEDEHDLWTLEIHSETNFVRIFQRQLNLSKNDGMFKNLIKWPRKKQKKNINQPHNLRV